MTLTDEPRGGSQHAPGGSLGPVPILVSATVRSMSDRTIPQRELRNNVGGVLRAAEGGQRFTVTVRGRPVARLVPLDDDRGPRREVDQAAVFELLSTPIDHEFAHDLDASEAPLENPWNDD